MSRMDQITTTLHRNSGDFLVLAHKEGATILDDVYLYRVFTRQGTKHALEYGPVRIHMFLDCSVTSGCSGWRNYNHPATLASLIDPHWLKWAKQYLDVANYNRVDEWFAGDVLAIARF